MEAGASALVADGRGVSTGIGARAAAGLELALGDAVRGRVAGCGERSPALARDPCSNARAAPMGIAIPIRTATLASERFRLCITGVTSEAEHNLQPPGRIARCRFRELKWAAVGIGSALISQSLRAGRCLNMRLAPFQTLRTPHRALERGSVAPI